MTPRTPSIVWPQETCRTLSYPSNESVHRRHRTVCGPHRCPHTGTRACIDDRDESGAHRRTESVPEQSGQRGRKSRWLESSPAAQRTLGIHRKPTDERLTRRSTGPASSFRPRAEECCCAALHCSALLSNQHPRRHSRGPARHRPTQAKPSVRSALPRRSSAFQDAAGRRPQLEEARIRARHAVLDPATAASAGSSRGDVPDWTAKDRTSMFEPIYPSCVRYHWHGRCQVSRSLTICQSSQSDVARRLIYLLVSRSVAVARDGRDPNQYRRLATSFG